MKRRRYRRVTFNAKTEKQQLHKRMAARIRTAMPVGGSIASLTGETIDKHWEWANPLLGKFGQMFAVEHNSESAQVMTDIAAKINDPKLQVIHADIWDVVLNPDLFHSKQPLQIVDLDMCCSAHTLIEMGFEEKLTKLVKSGNLRKSGAAIMITLCTRSGRGAKDNAPLLSPAGIPEIVDRVFSQAGWTCKYNGTERYKEGAPMWQYLAIFKMDSNNWQK